MSGLEICFYVWSWVGLLLGVYAGFKSGCGEEGWRTGTITLLIAFIVSAILAIDSNSSRFFLGMAAYFVGLVVVLVADIHPSTSRGG